VLQRRGSNLAIPSDALQLLGRIGRRIDLSVRLADHPVRTDEVGDPPRELLGRTAGCSIAERDCPVGVGDERKVEFVFVSECRVVLRVVEADADDRSVLLLIGIGEVPEPGTFGCSARCVGLRIEPENDVPPAVIAERNPLPLEGSSFEVGSEVARLERQGASEQ
jgi:hypothetical protein